MIKEKRIARRQPLRYTAWVALSADQRHGCVVSDVSDSGARIALAATLRVLGVHLSRSPKLAACQQDEAENQVAGGGIDGFRCKVNARPISRGGTGINITL